MTYSIDSTTDGCYPGTTCLVNKLGIQDELALAETEAAVVLGKASLLDQQPIPGVFDFDHYKRIHQFLFCDLYDWAGQIRTINISKKGTAFVSAVEIEPCADACFKRLADFSSEGLSHRELAEEIADFLGKDLAGVQEICRIAETFAPEYDMEQIYRELKSIRMTSES